MSIMYERLITVLDKVKNIIDSPNTDIIYSGYNSVEDILKDIDSYVEKLNKKNPSVIKEENESFKQLFYSDVEDLDELPNSETDEIRLFDTMPESLTYPLIQPYLFNKVEEFYKELKFI